MAQAVPGLILLGVGLIGMWLMGPKKSPTAKPDTMPQLNQALRGSPIPVTFGSNRVYSQITWTNKFQAIRSKSSGKGGGKGGGSGGFGSAKGGAAGQGYDYFWDMMFNFGIMDTPVVPRRGWIGGDLISYDTLNSITAGATASVQSVFPIFTENPATQTAVMKFTEAFYAPAYTTGDARLSSWAYFQSAMGFDCQWPNTAWIGFNQLALGQSPTVPQISLEFVPVTDTTGWHTPEFDVLYQQTEHQTAQVEPFMRDDNGNLYAFGLDDGGSTFNRERAAIYRLSDGQKTVVLNDTFDQDRADLGLTSTANEYQTTVFVPDTPYFYIIARHFVVPVHYIGVLYKVNTDGTITRNGGWEYRTDPVAGGFIGGGPNLAVAVRRMATGEVVYVHQATGSNGPSDGSMTFIHKLPDPVLLLGSNTDVQISASKWENIGFEVPVGGSFVAPGSYREGELSRGGVVEALGSFIVYFGRGEMSWANDNSSGVGFSQYVHDHYTGHENGMLVAVDLTIGTPSIINAYDTDGTTPLIPMADLGLDHTGGTGTDYDDYGPFVQGGNYIGWGRSFSDAPDFARVKMFQVISGKLRLTATVEGEAQNVSGSQTQNQYTTPYIDPFNNNLYTAMSWDGHGANPGTVFSFFAAAANLHSDVTPPYIIHRILTSEVFGFQTQALFGYTVTSDRINDTSLQAAIAYCEDQGIKVSVTYSNQDDLLTILNELLALYGGFLTDPAGVINFNVVTGVDNPVRTIDNHHLVTADGAPPVNVTKAAIEDGYNLIEFNYLDRAIDYKQNTALASDEVDIDINGPRKQTYAARFVMPGSLAQMCATRALWANLYGKDTYSFVLGWKDADLSHGDLITLVDSFDPTLSGGVRARIVKWKNPKRGRYEVDAVQEFPYIITASAFFDSQTDIDAGFAGLIDAPKPPLFQTAYELPTEFQGAKAHVYFGYNQQNVAMGSQLYLSHDGENYIQTSDVQPYVIGGKMAAPLENRQPGACEENVEFYLLPASGFSVATPTFVQNISFDDITQAVRAQGGGVFIVGSEAISVQDLTLLAQNRYRARRMFRGWGGTPISAHNSGEFFHHFAAGVHAHEITLDDVGTKISYKIVPYNFAGVPYDVQSIDASSYQIIGYYWLPRILPRLDIFVNSALAWDASTPVVGPYVGVSSGGSDIALGWQESSNVEGFGAGGYGAGGFGHFVTEVDTPEYRIDVASKNGVKVSSYVVNTGYFTYTLNQNSTDFAGFGHDLVLTVTPFNVKGDGPVGDTRSLSLNW